jgi:hypothetical protein
MTLLQMIYDVCGRQVRLWRVRKVRGKRVAIEVPLVVDGG